MMKLFNIFIIIWLSVFTLQNSLLAQASAYEFEQIDSLQKLEKRNIVVFIHTDWCKYCQNMLNTSFKNARNIKLLNSKYYFIKLNAEERRVIQFNNHSYNFKPTGSNTGIHELAEQLASIEGKVSYPTLCILNPENEIAFQNNQFINAKDLHDILTKIK